MFKKLVEYEDYAGEKRSVTLYFNISKAEVAEMEMNESQMAADGGIQGGLEEKLETIKAGGKGSEILKAFKDIVFMSYGKRVHDPELGEIFDKSADISRRFERSGAYTEFFMWLIENAENAALFVNGAFPQDTSAATRDQDKPDPSRRPGQQAPAVQTPPVRAVEPTQGREPTEEEIQRFLSNRKDEGNN